MNKASFRALILLYHQVIDRKYDPFCLAVGENNFIAQMQYLKKHYSIISMDELILNLKKNGKQIGKPIVVTFDDGYCDNYYNASRILNNLKIPATFFISSGNINRSGLFWWDTLTALFAPGVKFPRIIRITIKSRKYSWRVGSKNREKVFFEVYFLLRQLPVAAIIKVIRQPQLLVQNPIAPECSYRTINQTEINNLSKNPFFCIGAHTHNHPFMSGQTAYAQKKEIVNTKKILEKIIHSPVEYFSYPYGTKESYNAKTICYLKKNNFKAACTVCRNIVSSGVNLFELPRVPIENWKIAEFKSRIKRLFSW